VLSAGGFYLHATPLPEAHQLARAARYHHPMADVWAAVLDLEKAPEWRTDLAGMERQADVRGHEVWRELPRSGGPVTFETVELLKDRRQVRCVIDQGGPYGGCITAELIRRDDGAIVTLAEHLTVHSALFRYTHTVAGRRAALDAWLTDLGRRFGETPEIADLPKDLRDPPAPPVDAGAATGGEGPVISSGTMPAASTLPAETSGPPVPMGPQPPPASPAP
jgi:uncharacterized protein YndB with AHSA1/START domain